MARDPYDPIYGDPVPFKRPTFAPLEPEPDDTFNVNDYPDLPPVPAARPQSGWGLGSIIGAQKGGIDALARSGARTLGLPVRDDATTGSIVRSILGLEKTPDSGYLSRLAGGAVELGTDIATDPLSYETFGLGKLVEGGSMAGRVLAKVPDAAPEMVTALEQAARMGSRATPFNVAATAAFTGLMAPVAVDRGLAFAKEVQKNGFTPEAAEQALHTAVAGLGATAGLFHAAKILKRAGRTSEAAQLEQAAQPAPPVQRPDMGGVTGTPASPEAMPVPQIRPELGFGAPQQTPAGFSMQVPMQREIPMVPPEAPEMAPSAPVEPPAPQVQAIRRPGFVDEAQGIQAPVDENPLGYGRGGIEPGGKAPRGQRDPATLRDELSRMQQEQPLVDSIEQALREPPGEPRYNPPPQLLDEMGHGEPNSAGFAGAPQTAEILPDGQRSMPRNASAKWFESQGKPVPKAAESRVEPMKFTPEQEALARQAFPENARDAPEFVPEKPAFGEGYPGHGWKLHLATDTPEAVSAVLKEMGLQHKVGRSDQAGKDLTVYVGSRESAVAAAKAISERAGKMLKESHGETLRDDVQLAPKVAGRFDAGRGGEFNQYGAKGFPLLNEDVQASLWDKANFDRPAAEARAQKALRDKYGEFYAGKETPVGEEVRPVGGQPEVPEPTRTPEAAPTEVRGPDLGAGREGLAPEVAPTAEQATGVETEPPPAVTEPAGPTVEMRAPEPAKESAPTDIPSSFEAAKERVSGESPLEMLKGAAGARARLRARAKGTTANLGLDPQALTDLATVGAEKIAQGAKSFGEFSKGLISEFGDGVREALSGAWKQAKKEVPEVTPDQIKLRKTATTVSSEAERIHKERNFEGLDSLGKSVRRAVDEFSAKGDPNGAAAMRGARDAVDRATKARNAGDMQGAREALEAAGRMMTEAQNVKQRLPIATNIYEGIKHWGSLTKDERVQVGKDLVNHYANNLFSTTSFTLDLVGNAVEAGAHTIESAAKDIAHAAKGDLTFPHLNGIKDGILSRINSRFSPLHPDIEAALDSRGFEFGEPLAKGKWGTFTKRENAWSKLYDAGVGTPLYMKGATDLAFKRMAAVGKLYEDAHLAADAKKLTGPARERFINEQVKNPSEAMKQASVDVANKAGFNRPLTDFEESLARNPVVKLFGEAFPRWPLQFGRWAGEMLGANPELIKKVINRTATAEEVAGYLGRTATGWGGLYLASNLYDRTDPRTMEYIQPNGDRTRLAGRDPIPTAMWMLAILKGDKKRAAQWLPYATVPGGSLLSGEGGGLLGKLLVSYQKAIKNPDADPRDAKRIMTDALARAIPGQALFAALKSAIDPVSREGFAANLPGLSLLEPARISRTTGRPLEQRQRILGVEGRTIASAPVPGATRVVEPVEKLLNAYDVKLYRAPAGPLGGQQPNQLTPEMRREWDKEFGAARERFLTPLLDPVRLRSFERMSPDAVRRMIQAREVIASRAAMNAINQRFGTSSRKEKKRFEQTIGPVGELSE